MNQSAISFRRDREADWVRLEALVASAERGSVRALSDNDLLALPVLYRAVLSALSVARETSLDRALITYLEALATRAYFVVYGVRRSLRFRVASFILHGWPAAVASLWRETLLAVGLLAVGTAAGYFLVAHDAAWFSALIPNDLAAGRTPAAATEALRQTIYDKSSDSGLGLFATSLFTHNAQVAILSFSLGFAFGVPTALLLLTNGAQLGALLAVFASHGLSREFGAWLAIHGTTELFALAIAAAAGFRIGNALLFPGPAGRVASAAAAGRTGATVMIGAMVMLSVAGLLEGIGRQTIQVDASRYGIGIAALLLWLAYFFGFRGGRRGS
jgi:uncharacterized membrane protein SpoIIM required for sporulation